MQRDHIAEFVKKMKTFKKPHWGLHKYTQHHIMYRKQKHGDASEARLTLWNQKKFFRIFFFSVSLFTRLQVTQPIYNARKKKILDQFGKIRKQEKSPR